MNKKRIVILHLIACLLTLSSLDNHIIAQKSYDRYEYEPEKYKAIGGNIYVGYGLLTGNISDYFTNTFLSGFNVDFYRQRMVFQIDGHLGFGITEETMVFTQDLGWEDNKLALHVNLGGNFGYRLVDTESIKIVPLAGIGLGGITPLPLNSYKVDKPLFPYFNLGCYIDLKFLKFFKPYLIFSDDDYYSCVRLSFGIKHQIGKRKYDSFYQGNMIYFTIGFAGSQE